MRLNVPEMPSPSDELLARYLSNEVTLPERQRVQRWAAADPARTEMLAMMTGVWDEPARALDDWDRDRLYAAFDARRNAFTGRRHDDVIVLDQTTTRTTRARGWRYARVAAAVVGVAVVAWVAATIVPRTRVGDIVTPSTKTASTPAAPVQYATGGGQRATLQLEDGSTVTLAPGSRLLHVNASASSREVALEGEAYFDVVAKPDRPFIVHAGPSIVRVLGTAFNVRRYAGDTATIVAVSQGRVTVEEGGVTTLLSAGQLTVIPAHGPASVLQDAAAVDAATAWRNGWIHLDHVSLRAAAAELGRWYDIDIRVSDDSLADRTIIVSFKDQDMNTVLHHIADALDARVERVGRTVTFSTR